MLMNKNKIILHIDLDAFFASCEERENPHFRGKPIIVGANPKHGTGRGVVSTANYIARKYGVHSAMPISQAYHLCPEAIFLPPNISLYNRVSESVMAILQSFTQKHKGKFEQTSIDEAFIELTFPSSQYTNTHDRGYLYNSIAQDIKLKIKSKEKITASIGIGPNMLIAKIASDFHKPNGLTIVKSADVQKFLDPMPVKKIPGVGPKTEQELKRLGIYIIADLRKMSQSALYDNFGQHGIDLYEAARGINNREISEQTTTKSISEEHTFEKDTSSAQEILPVLFSLTRNVLEIASGRDYKNFKTITIKIRYANFKTHTKSLSGNYDIGNIQKIERIALKLFWPFLNEVPQNRTTNHSDYGRRVRGSVSSYQIKDLEKKRKIRLVGFRVSGFK